MGVTEPTADPHDPTELAGVAEADTQSGYAWGEVGEDGIPEEVAAVQRGWVPSLVTSAVVLASLAIVGAAAAVAYNHLREPVSVVVATPSPTPTTTTTTTEPPRPMRSAAPGEGWVPTPTKTTVTVQAPPPQPSVALTPYDRKFLNQLQSEGWIITDPALMLYRARQVCVYLQQGVDPEVINQGLINEGIYPNGSEAFLFSSAVMLNYPRCFPGGG